MSTDDGGGEAGESAADHAEGSDYEGGDGQEDGRRGSTGSPSERHWLTNDGMAWVLTLSMVAAILLSAVGVVDLSNVPQEILVAFVGAFGVSIVWAFGRDALEAWRGGESR